ncbi:acetylornithine deacetylase [Caldinitratiruptor microaerophilus]|uniref:Probable succinyl-diaminopimelate desuccinylase n=1 Tax=Caldinitratiruptor microaerophilus TaxID=671077 RepID=A0AA35CIC1_9FIRM|nr:acetylornithine deacetylase [Caldinitratiruptor microaerophilus]BDG59654.1 N-formyl-4-amino-5-aminomethyl-2-methylpyrimidine deformylase [Caldinitratiruptor microaerophilus]
MEDRLQAAERYIDEHRGALLALLQDLVAFRTEAPPARNAAGAQAYVARYLQELGLVTDVWDVFPGDPNVVGVRRGDPRKHSLLINGHIDVAEVGEGHGWTRDPFTCVLESGRVYGRGTADMKGGLAAALFALRALADAGVPTGGDVIFESVVGEEQGEAGTRSCNERGYRADFGLVPDTSGLAIQGQGGVITGWITIQSPRTFHDGMRSRLIHAGGGVRGFSAIEKMAKVIQALGDLERYWAVTRAYPGIPPGSNTINPAVIEGGRHPAFVADRCALWITVHFHPDQTYQEVTREIEEHVLAAAQADPWLREHPPTFRWGGRSMIEDRGEIFPALPLPADHPATRLLVAAHEQVVGRPPELGMSRTVTDAGWLGDAGIPAVIYGPGELDHAHAVDESCDFEQIVQAAKVYARFIATWTNTDRP